MTNRREFLGMSAGACSGPARSGIGTPTGRVQPKTILMLGGTGFLGPQTVEAAIRRGHKVTLFNRGKTRPGLFPDLEKLHGDREKDDLKALEGRKWDAVVDTSANVPRWVKKAAAVLGPNIGHYIYISSISVYADTEQARDRRDGPGGHDRRPDDREDRRPDLWRPEGPDGEGGRGGDAGQGGRGAAGPDRRARGPERPVHLLAGARRPGRRGARSRLARRPDPAHRRPRPRGIPRPADRGQDDGGLQRPRARQDADDGPDARGLQGGRPERRDLHLGRRRVPGEAGRPRLERHAGLGAQRRRDGRLRQGQQRTRHQGGADVPPDRRHGQGHAGLVPDPARGPPLQAARRPHAASARRRCSRHGRRGPGSRESGPRPGRPTRAVDVEESRADGDAHRAARGGRSPCSGRSSRCATTRSSAAALGLRSSSSACWRGTT